MPMCSQYAVSSFLMLTLGLEGREHTSTGGAPAAPLPKHFRTSRWHPYTATVLIRHQHLHWCWYSLFNSRALTCSLAF